MLGMWSLYVTLEDDSKEWVRELLAGNNDVVAEFCALYGPTLERLAQSHMNSALQRRVGADDIVQSVCRTFVRRARQGDIQVDESEALWRLLCAITLTKVRQHARFHYRKRRGLNREQVGPDADAGQHSLRASEPTPAEAAAFNDQMQHFIAALDEEAQRFVLLRMQGMTHEEIAGELDCAERTVRRILQRVRAQWEQELALL